MSAEPMVILLAEDDEAHAVLVKKNLLRAGIANEVIHVSDGQEALDFVNCEGRYDGRTPAGPLLLVLDINMPRVDGVEVLEKIKGGESMAKITVIMLTTTDDPREVARCHELGCNNYIVKPVGYEKFAAAIQQLGLFISLVQVPDLNGRAAR